jgi:hypothetical protein
LTALPAEDVTVDIHCVTKWSKLDTRWKGVSVDTLLDGIETEADWMNAFADALHDGHGARVVDEVPVAGEREAGVVAEPARA